MEGSNKSLQESHSPQPERLASVLQSRGRLRELAKIREGRRRFQTGCGTESRRHDIVCKHWIQLRSVAKIFRSCRSVFACRAAKTRFCGWVVQHWSISFSPGPLP